MCGFAGVANLNTEEAISPDCLRTMVANLEHRGPDGNGMFLRPHVALGATRLAIVDLEHGHQPMHNESGTVTVAYNGEIYNHAELRSELESCGHRFMTRADTEILPHAYEEWGAEGLLTRLEGMFAFALWDEERRTLMLARDRMGMKPLYYLEHQGRLYFASEIRPLLLASRVDRVLNFDAFTLFMRLGYVPAPHTMFQKLHKLHAANYALVREGHWTTHCYWRLSYRPRPLPSEHDTVNAFRSRLDATVQAHRMSDVPIGALLSGGVDSGTVAALLKHGEGPTPAALTVGFSEHGYDETGRATQCAEELGLDHRVIRFDNSSMADYPEMLEAYEEPSARSTFTALYYLFQACRQQGLKVVLTGEGADELLGGYFWNYHFILPEATWSAGADWYQAVLPFRRLVQRYVEYIQISKPGAARGLLSAEAGAEVDSRDFDELLDPWVGWAKEAGDSDPFQSLLWLQSRTRLPDYITHNLDRMSMAHSVEARPPYLDHSLWEFCAPLPRSIKVRGFHPHQTEKYLLRKAGEGMVPECVRTSRKTPLRVPFLEWLDQPQLPDWAEAALTDTELTRVGLFDPPAVRSLRSAARSDPGGQGTLLMAVMTMQLWMRAFSCRAS